MSEFPKVLEAWLDEHNALLVWASKRWRDEGTEALAYRVGKGLAVVLLYHGRNGVSWDLYTCPSTNVTSAIFEDAERRLGITKNP